MKKKMVELTALSMSAVLLAGCEFTTIPGEALKAAKENAKKEEAAEIDGCKHAHQEDLCQHAHDEAERAARAEGEGQPGERAAQHRADEEADQHQRPCREARQRL